MKAKIICMASAKGGSGKTVLTATFGAFLAALGKKVLAIDTDSATNGLTLLYLKEVMLQGELAIANERQPRGILDFEVSADRPEIVPLKTGMHLIPATYGFTRDERPSEIVYRSHLRDVLEEAREKFDFILLDAEAGADPYAHVAMSRGISDEVVIVSEYDPMSAAGVERLKGLFREDLTYSRTWVLLNKMLPEFVQSFSDFLEVAKYISPIPWDADVVKAYARRRLALDLDAGNEFTLAIIQSIRSLLGDEIAAELEAWSQERAVTIRQPIKSQVEDLEIKLAAVLKQQNEVAASRIRLKWLATVVVGVVGAAGFILGSRQAFLNMDLLGAALFALAISGMALLFFMPLLQRLDQDPRDAQLAYREQELRGRLERLNLLMEADLETLIKARAQQRHTLLGG